MRTITELRAEIDNCDEEIISALQRRIQAISEVGMAKKMQSLPVYQPQRESAIIDKLKERLEVAQMRDCVVELYELIMRQSRRIQNSQRIDGNIVLVGFMCCGKTTVGRALAELSGFDFVDIDEVVENEQQRSIAAIFAEHGEAFFRECERAAICAVAGRKHTIIACGGGAALDDANVAELKRGSTVVWLRASVAEIIKRLQTASFRPLVKDKSSAEITELYFNREEFYRRAADCTIDANGDKQRIAAAILETVAKGVGK